MALETSMTGTGSYGDITPGWIVNESATPVAIGDQGANTGSVSFTARSTDESLLVINNEITSTPNDLGTVVGIVQSVTENGATASITHGTYLDKFNLDVAVPPVESGGVKAWFYQLGEVIFGEQPRPDYSIPVSTTYTGAVKQYSYCFPMDNNSLDVSGLYSIDTLFRTSTKSSDGSAGYSFTPNGQPAWDTFQSTTPMLPGIKTAGNWYAPNPMLPDLFVSFEPYFDIMMDVDASTYVRLWIKGGTDESAPTYANLVRITIDGSTGTVELMNLFDEVATTIDFNSIENGNPLLFTFWHTTSSPAALPGSQFNRFNCQVRNSAGSATTTAYTDCYLSGILNFAGDYISCDKMYYVNAAYVLSYTGTYRTLQPITYPFNIDFTGYTTNYIGAYPSTVGVAWELMQQLAAAENFEIAVNGDTVYVRDIDPAHVLDISNLTAPATINPTSTLSGRQINIPYTDARFVNGVVYNSYDDGNNIISVNAGETTVTTVKHTVHPIALLQPRLVNGTEWPTTANEYTVMDSSGYYLNSAEWEGYGGSVTVNIAPDDPAGIEITVKGPYTDVTLAGGPYKLAVSDGSNEYASLVIGGSGVYSGDGVLNLLTGIDSDKYTRATINTITNPFITTLEQAYDRGVWAAQKASGPVVTISGSVPTRAIVGVGETGGSFIDYRDSKYRVTANTIGAVASSFTAERYVTVADVDAIWGTGITAPQTFTMTIASPAVFTATSHGLTNGDFVSFSTTGQLPNNLATSSTIWGGYVINSATNTFQLSATPGGLAINSTGTQSGTHSFITGDTSVNQYDGLWGNYECQDQIIFPFKVA